MITENQHQAAKLISTFEHDVNVSAAEKHRAFKMLRTILQNLIDPNKGGIDVKYRQLRLGKPKIRALTGHAAVFALLTGVVGFERQQQEAAAAGETVLVMPMPPTAIGKTQIESALALIVGSLQRVAVLVPPSSGNSACSSSAGSSVSSSIGGGTATATTNQPANAAAAMASSSSSSKASASGMSEKQKARLLREEQLRKEKEQAKESRKRTAAQIKADKHVRQNDPNWKPSVNAAAAKAGTSLQTFRDKYGEH